MNHKNIIKLFAAVFAFSIFNSLLVLFTKLPGNPEIFFTVFFSVLIIACIVFFKREDLVKDKLRKASYVKVLGQNLIICKNRPAVKRKSLFLRVSIITLLGSLFGKKK